jgi:hypothetical protein
VKIRPWGAAKAEGMGAFFNTLLTLAFMRPRKGYEAVNCGF